MWKIIARKDDFVLVEGEPGFFAFGHEINLLDMNWGFPVDQCGSAEELIQTLRRWGTEVDVDNLKMKEIERCFIGALSTIKS